MGLKDRRAEEKRSKAEKAVLLEEIEKINLANTDYIKDLGTIPFNELTNEQISLLNLEQSKIYSHTLVRINYNLQVIIWLILISAIATFIIGMNISSAIPA